VKVKLWHILIYVVLILYNLAIVFILQAAYVTKVDPVTLPQIGFFYAPRDLIPVPELAAVVLIFWSVVNLYGLAINAEWGRQARNWGVIIAIMFALPVYASVAIPVYALVASTPTLIVMEPGLAYCIAEGGIIVTERQQND
jgi:hypothetical protein